MEPRLDSVQSIWVRYSDHSNELHGIRVHTGGASQPVLVADEHAGAEEMAGGEHLS